MLCSKSSDPEIPVLLSKVPGCRFIVLSKLNSPSKRLIRVEIDAEKQYGIFQRPNWLARSNYRPRRYGYTTCLVGSRGGYIPKLQVNVKKVS